MSDRSSYPAGATGAPEETASRAKLQDLLRVLSARRRVVLACATAVVAGTMAYTLFATPLYQATATLQIEMLSPEILTFKDVVKVDSTYYGNAHYYQTQYKLLKSRPVLLLAVDRLDLLNRPEFAARKQPPAARLLQWLKRPSAGGEPADARLAALAFLSGPLTVKPIRDSQLVEVSFSSPDPDLAADVVNAVTEAYLEFSFRSRFDTTKVAREFLTEEVARITGEITDLEKRLQDYAGRKDIVAVGAGTQDITEQALSDANRRYVDARSRLAVAEARWVSVRQTPPEALPDVMHSPLISKLKEQYAAVERQHGQMAERFKEGWPPLVQLRAEMEQSRASLAEETEAIARQVRAGAEADFERARAEVGRFDRELDLQKGEVQRAQRDAIGFAGLKAEIDSKRRVLENLRTRQSETATSERLSNPMASNIRVVDTAEPPKSPVWPKRLQNLVMAILVGLVLGIGAAFLVDHLDNSVKGPHDVERLAGIAVLGQIPRHQALRAVEGSDADKSRAARLDLVSHLDPRSTFAEAFRSLRTSFLLSTPDHPARHLVVSSCQPEEGKSTVSVNLATVLTQLGRRVLLVDADLRAPRLHTVLDLSNQVGLSSYLSGNAGAETLVQETAIPGLSAIPSGPTPPNPSELLGSPKLEVLLEHLARHARFDYVVFDSSPLLLVTDPLILASRMDATIIVVRAGVTAREALVQGVARLRQSRARIVGAVLNGADDDADAYYGKYRYVAGASPEAPAGPGAVAAGGRGRAGA